jgi:hypothetical protein
MDPRNLIKKILKKTKTGLITQPVFVFISGPLSAPENQQQMRQEVSNAVNDDYSAFRLWAGFATAALID